MRKTTRYFIWKSDSRNGEHLTRYLFETRNFLRKLEAHGNLLSHHWSPSGARADLPESYPQWSYQGPSLKGGCILVDSSYPSSYATLPTRLQRRCARWIASRATKQGQRSSSLTTPSSVRAVEMPIHQAILRSSGPVLSNNGVIQVVWPATAMSGAAVDPCPTCQLLQPVEASRGGESQQWANNPIQISARPCLSTTPYQLGIQAHESAAHEPPNSPFWGKYGGLLKLS